MTVNAAGDVARRSVSDATGTTLSAGGRVSMGGPAIGFNRLSVHGNTIVDGTLTVDDLRFTGGYTTGDLLSIDAAGNVVFVAPSTVVTSDERLKRDVAPITGALDKIGQLRNVSFRYRTGLETPGLSLDTAVTTDSSHRTWRRSSRTP